MANDGFNILKNIRSDQLPSPKGFGAKNYPRPAIGTVTSAEILALTEAPKTLIAAPGAGNYVVVESAVFFNDFGETAYVGAGTLSVNYTDVDGDSVLSDLSETGFLEAAADVVVTLTPVAVIAVANAPVILVANSSNPTTGDGVIKYEIVYRIVTF